MTPAAEASEFALHHWEGFYVIVGTSAAALTGLMFVVLAVAVDAGPRAASTRSIETYVTPTIVHFSASLLFSAILSAPWPGPLGIQIMLGAAGITGLVYSLFILRWTRDVKTYSMVLEDWVWHIVFPLLAYGATIASAIVLGGHPLLGLFLAGGASTLLLLIGIHNAWDTVTHLTFQRLKREQEKTE